MNCEQNEAFMTALFKMMQIGFDAVYKSAGGGNLGVLMNKYTRFFGYNVLLLYNNKDKKWIIHGGKY
jgi:hypothetical protein